MVNAIIMASGLSRRMGKNKLLLKYKEIPVIEHVLIEISKCKFNEVILVSQYDKILELGQKYGFKLIKNNNAEIGQSESIKLGLQNSSKCDGFMFFVGDQPKVSSKYINKLLDSFDSNKDNIVIPRYKNRCGNPVIFPYDKKDALLLLNNDEKGRKVINNSNQVIYIDVIEDMLFDIDTKEDYEKLKGE